MNNPTEAETLILPAIRRLGFDPADLKYVLITHGHGDHFGGARYLQDTFGARVMLSDTDWGLIENRTANAAANLPGPRRDMVATDGQELRLGDTTIRIIHTPGHSPGTISFIIPARWQGQTHYLTLAGGSAIPGGNAAATQYLASFQKLWDAGRAANAEGVLSTHEFMMGAIEKLDAIRNLRPGEPNPLILGRDGYERFMQTQGMCVLASVTRGFYAAGGAGR
jgi:metallo-beta-lactamase class B